MVRVSSWVALCLALAGCRGDASTAPKGKELYASLCARCHGPQGQGGAAAVEGAPRPRDFTDPANHAQLTDADIERVIRAGKPMSGMPGFRETATDEQVKSLIPIVRGFKREAAK